MILCIKKFNYYKIKVVFIFFNAIFICFYSGKLHSHPLTVTTVSEELITVGIPENQAPFSFLKDSIPTGIALEIWEDIARINDWNYKYVIYESVNATLEALKIDSIDVAVGPISITSHRLKEVQFSQPFYATSLAIVSNAEELSWWQKTKPFFSLRLAGAVLVFLFILVLVGAVLWLAERKKSDQFPSDPLNGIGNGMWLAIVTMSTTGYGDKAPITLSGRIIAGSWMIISIIFATSIVGGIASVLTVSSLGKKTITAIEQLSGKTAATIAGSPSVLFLKDHQINTVDVSSLNEAIELLQDEKVDTVIYDRPELLYILKKLQDENLHIANAEYYKRGYGFAFPLHSTRIYEVNLGLLQLSEKQKIERILIYYLDEK